MQAQARAQTTGVALNHFRAVVAAAAALGTFLFFVVFSVLFLFFNVPSTSSAVCPRVGTCNQSVYRERGTGTFWYPRESTAEEYVYRDTVNNRAAQGVCAVWVTGQGYNTM